MKKSGSFQFIIGFVLGAAVFSSSIAVATGILAQPKTAAVVIDGKTVDLKGYVIEDAHYFQLRDLSAALAPSGKDFSIFWDEQSRRILISTGRGYNPSELFNAVANSSPGITNSNPATGSGNAASSNYGFATDHPTADSSNTGNIGYSVPNDTNNSTGAIVSNPSFANSATGATISNASSSAAVADGSGRISDTMLTEKTIDGRELSREDFSQKANPAAFVGIYTRGLYNAIRQSIVDMDKILPGNDDSGFNPYYCYANFVDKYYIPGENDFGTTLITASSILPGRMSAYYCYTLSAENYAKDYYKYDGYGIVTVQKNEFLAPANAATESMIREIKGFSDREKVIRLADAICDRMSYGKSNGNGINEMFASDAPTTGQCAIYANTFLYLCQRAGIPCLICSDYDHAWNIVYVDGEWLIADVTNYDTSRSMIWLLTTDYPKQDKKPTETMFLQEILVPNSTVR